MTQKAIKNELLLLDRGGSRGGEMGGRRKGFSTREGGEDLEIGADEKWNFRTAAYIILLIKDSNAFILVCFLECVMCVGLCARGRYCRSVIPYS